MKRCSNRSCFWLNSITIALTLLPGILVSQRVYAEPAKDVKTTTTQNAEKRQPKATIQVVATPDKSSPASMLKAPVSVGALGTASVLDTPFSVSTVIQQTIQNKQVTTAKSLFADDASVIAYSSLYSNYGSQFSVRGISSEWDSFINGLPATAISQEAHPEMFEQVNVLKGATGFMYGFGAPGGAMNYLTKRPVDDSFFEFTTGYRSKGVFSQAIDTGGRAGADKRFGFRLNMVNEQGSTSVRDARISRQALGLALDAQLLPGVTLYSNLIYGKRFIKNPSADNFGISPLASANKGLPAPVRLNQLLTHVGDAHIDDRSVFSQTGAKWDFNENWRIQADYVFQKNNERFVSPIPELTDQNGDYVMSVYDTKVFNTNQIVQAVLQGKINSGFISHQLNSGFTNRIYKTARSPQAVFSEIGSGNIFKPVIIDYQQKSMSSPAAYETTTERAVFISDRLIFNDHWEFIAGIRHTQYMQQNPRRKEEYNKTVNTPTLAIIFKPESSTSIYTSYVEALEQGGIVRQRYKNANEMLPPLKSRQYELGIKTAQKRWNATAALFRIERAAEYANADNVWVQDGKERYQGLEVAGKVIISKNFDLNVSTLWLDPTYRSVAPTNNIEGKTVAGVPRFRSAVELVWMPDGLPGLSTFLRWRHEGSASPDEKNNLRVPAYDLLDLYINYDTDVLGQAVTARFGVTNLTDKKYWTAGGYSRLYAGEPRTFMANVSVRF